MAKIVSFICCNNINEQNGAPVIIAPMQFIAVPFFPTNFTFFVSLGLKGIDISSSVVSVIIKSPENQEISRINSPIPDLMGIEGLNINMPIGIQINLEFRNIVIPSAGNYTFEILYNEENIGSFEMEAIKSVA